MSHTVKLKMNLSDVDHLRTACEQLGYGFRSNVEAIKLYANTVKDAHEVKIPGWNYPVAVKGDEVLFDNYEGGWGDPKLLKRLENRYSNLVVEQAAKARGDVTRWTVDAQGRTTLEVLKAY